MYLSYRYVPSPHSIYSGYRKLAPGSWLELDCDTLSMKENVYWRLPDTDPEADTKEIFEEIEGAVARHMIADVPVKTFLSGGIDSSLITALASRQSRDLSSYAISVADSHRDESQEAKRVAHHLGLSLNVELLDKKRFQDTFVRALGAYDEPLGDTSVVPTYVLCDHTVRHAKVALSGDGGDELFFGYHWHRKWWDCYRAGDRSMHTYRRLVYNAFEADEIASLLGSEIYSELSEHPLPLGGNECCEDVRSVDFTTYLLDDILTKIDTASMAHSLEVRVPFLDYRLIERVMRLPLSRVFYDNRTKALLKDMSTPWLPWETINRGKQGFSIPSVSWLKGRSAWLRSCLMNGYLVNDGIFNKRALKQILFQPQHEERLWLLLSLEFWYASHYHPDALAIKEPGLMGDMAYCFQERLLWKYWQMTKKI